MIFAPAESRTEKPTRTTKSRFQMDKGDRVAMYITLKADDPVRRMNVPIPLPLSVTGTDMKRYIVDQYADSDGVYNMYVFLQTGPYDYAQLYKGEAFKFDVAPDASTTSSLNVDHYLGNENTTSAIKEPQPEMNDAKKQLSINWANLLKKVPSVLGHVVQIGTAIASLAEGE